MAFLTDNAHDSGLAYLTTNGTVVYICSAQPSNYTEASSTFALGNKTGMTVGAATDGDVSGRKVTIPAITDGSVTASGTATHWALVKPTATTELLAAGALGASQAVTSGNTFTLGATDIELPDPA